MKDQGIKWVEPKPESIKFIIDKVEMLRIEPNGEFYVKGKLVETDKEVYTEFKYWLNHIRSGTST